MIQLGLKLGSRNTQYTHDIIDYYRRGVFQYLELFVNPGTFEETADYWKQFPFPYIIHAPHYAAGMNMAVKEMETSNIPLIAEAFRFADALKAEYVIFHSGVNGTIEETARQLKPFADSRCLIENKPKKGLGGENCVGALFEELHYIINELKAGFCLDFGHAICAANSLKRDPFDFIKELSRLEPAVYHLTDGDRAGEKDGHHHYGAGTFPLKELLAPLPENAMLTNEAKHDFPDNLSDFEADWRWLKNAGF
jgi:endonuclease IV